MVDMQDTYLFGPVPSRRLGLSLGVDIVPFKICPLDCIYCQLGVTAEKQVRCDCAHADIIRRMITIAGFLRFPVLNTTATDLIFDNKSWILYKNEY